MRVSVRFPIPNRRGARPRTALLGLRAGDDLDVAAAGHAHVRRAGNVHAVGLPVHRAGIRQGHARVMSSGRCVGPRPAGSICRRLESMTPASAPPRVLARRRTATFGSGLLLRRWQNTAGAAFDVVAALVVLGRPIGLRFVAKAEFRHGLARESASRGNCNEMN